VGTTKLERHAERVCKYMDWEIEEDDLIAGNKAIDVSGDDSWRKILRPLNDLWTDRNLQAEILESFKNEPKTDHEYSLEHQFHGLLINKASSPHSVDILTVNPEDVFICLSNSLERSDSQWMT